MREKYCHFHHDHRHDTNDYFDLKEQIEVLIRWGRLWRFVTTQKSDGADKGPSQPVVKEKEGPLPLDEIRVIVGGSFKEGEFASARKVHV